VKVFGDDEMKLALTDARPYSVVILKAGPNRDAANADELVWEHGRRNFGLRDDGVLAIVLPVPGDSGVCGIGVFDATVEQTIALMDQDPAVQAGIFTYDVHACMGFPGDRLP
jgi:hypothetical protein